MVLEYFGVSKIFLFPPLYTEFSCIQKDSLVCLVGIYEKLLFVYHGHSIF